MLAVAALKRLLPGVHYEDAPRTVGGSQVDQWRDAHGRPGTLRRRTDFVTPLASGFDSILNAIAEAVLVTNRHGTIVLVNRQTERLLGYAASHLLGQSVELLVPEVARERHADYHREYLKAPRLRPMGEGAQLYVRCEDGSEIPVDIGLSPVTISGEAYVISTIHDVTARVQAEERRFRAIFQQKHQLAGIVELDGTLSDVNDCALDYSGLQRSDVIGQPFDKTGWWNHDPELQKRLRDAIRAAKKGATVAFDATHPKADGGLGLVDFSIRPVMDESGDVSFLVPESQDITDRRVAEDAKNALQRAVELAETATKTKSRFLAAASHDLRQPLQSLGLYLSVLDRQLDNDAHLEITAKMRRSLDVMGELLAALLDVSRFDSGLVVPKVSDFPLQDVFERIYADNVQQAEAKGLVLHVDATDLRVTSDPALLERIIENFVVNAIAYTNTGSITIACDVKGGYARITVADTGIGIANDQLESIFEEYYQLDNPMRNRQQGLGLGLSIVRQIARLLEHAVGVESTPGVGSRFSVDVPLAERDTAIEADEQVSARDASRSPVVVLLVDDDPAVLDSTGLLLDSEGCTVHTATCGSDGMDKLTAGLRPDVLITDFRLPDFDGLELIRRARRTAGSELPAIVITGDTSNSAADLGKSDQLHLLHKPVCVDDLLALVRRAREA